MTKLPSQNSSVADFVLPEEGIYRMRLIEVSEPILSQFKKKNGDDKFQVIMTFKIDDDESDSDGEELIYYASISMHPKSSMYAPVKALMGGVEIDPDDEIDLDELVNKYVLGTLTHVTKASTRTPGTMATYANITGFAPIRKKKKAVAADPEKPAKPAPKTEEDEIWDDNDDEDAA